MNTIDAIEGQQNRQSKLIIVGAVALFLWIALPAPMPKVYHLWSEYAILTKYSFAPANYRIRVGFGVFYYHHSKLFWYKPINVRIAKIMWTTPIDQ